jgi:hypothetical protein
MQKILIVLDFSVQPVSPNFKGQAGDFLTLKIGPTGCAETSGNYRSAPRRIAKVSFRVQLNPEVTQDG